jgi:hypothetical protein
MILISSNTRCLLGFTNMVVRTSTTLMTLYEISRPFTTLYDLTDVTFSCRVCGGGGLHRCRRSKTTVHPTTPPAIFLYVILSIVSNFSARSYFCLVLTRFVFSLSGRVIMLRTDSSNLFLWVINFLKSLRRLLRFLLSGYSHIPCCTIPPISKLRTNDHEY